MPTQHKNNEVANNNNLDIHQIKTNINSFNNLASHNANHLIPNPALLLPPPGTQFNPNLPGNSLPIQNLNSKNLLNSKNYNQVN